MGSYSCCCVNGDAGWKVFFSVNGLESLKSVTGSAFDKAYMAHELPFSKDFIRRLKEEILPAVTHEELKIFLQGLIPKFEEHLMHIEHTAMQLEMRTDGAGHNKAMHEKNKGWAD